MTQGEKSFDFCLAWPRCLEEVTARGFPSWGLNVQQLSVTKANATSSERCMERKDQEPAAFLGTVAQEGGKGAKKGFVNHGTGSEVSRSRRNGNVQVALTAQG